MPQQDEVFGVQMQDITMEDVNSQLGDTTINSIFQQESASIATSPNIDAASLPHPSQHHERASIPSSPTVYMTSRHSPSPSTPPQVIRHERSFYTSPYRKMDVLLTAERSSGYITPTKSQIGFKLQAIPDSPLFLSRPVPFTARSLSSASLESLDSLVESHWDPDDDENDDSSSEKTPLVRNGEHDEERPDFFAEHVHFLRVQTRPRTVQEIWSPSLNESPYRSNGGD